MTVRHASDRQSFLKMLRELENGECLEVDSFASVAADSVEMIDAVSEIAARGADFVSLQEEIDTRSEAGPSFFALCRALHALDE